MKFDEKDFVGNNRNVLADFSRYNYTLLAREIALRVTFSLDQFGNLKADPHRVPQRKFVTQNFEIGS